VRVIILAVMVAAVLAILVFWVFPAVQPYISPPPPETVSPS
jgi:hypothetical protein